MTEMTQQASGEKYKVIGTRPIRHDGVDKVTGRARYANDTNFAEYAVWQDPAQPACPCAYPLD